MARGRVASTPAPPLPSGGRWWAVVGLASALGWAAPRAEAQTVEEVARDLATVETDVDQLLRTAVKVAALRSPTYVEERIADGEIQLDMGDPLGASIVFTDVVDNFPDHRAYPDALYLLGESLFRAGDVYGARRRFREIVVRSEREQAFRGRLEASVVRLIEIAIRTRDFTDVEAQIASLDRAKSASLGGASTYYRGRYLFGRAVPPEGDAGIVVADSAALEEARRAFERVPEESAWYAKARYHVGAIRALVKDLDGALAAFREAAAAPGEGDEHRQVVELAQLGAARVLYEGGRLLDAADAYQLIPRSSPHFARALYEIAWVFIALGDTIQAERALEVLGVADPESPLLADGKVLRGNLLLRNGRYDEADAVFEDAREHFGPIARELDDLHAGHGDGRAHFRQLVRDNVDSFDADVFLPAHVRKWVQTDADFERALRVLRDLADANRLLGEAEGLLARLNGALTGSRAVAIFADLRAQAEKAAVLRSKLVRMLRATIARETDVSRPVAGELAEIRRRRREVESQLGAEPIGETYLMEKRTAAFEELRLIRRELRDLSVAVAGNEARIVATDRFLQTGELPGRTAESVGSEIDNHRRAAREHRATIEELLQLVDVLRLQAGIGDGSVDRESARQREYVALVAREVEALGALDPSSGPLLRRALALATRLEERERRVEAVAGERIARVREIVEEEVERLRGLASALDALSAEAEEVVGAVAYQTFLAVRARFHDLVIRTDVGRIDIAWAIREEHRSRVERLTRDRSKEIQALDAEFDEIMRDGESPERGGAP